MIVLSSYAIFTNYSTKLQIVTDYRARLSLAKITHLLSPCVLCPHSSWWRVRREMRPLLFMRTRPQLMIPWFIWRLLPRSLGIKIYSFHIIVTALHRWCWHTHCQIHFWISNSIPPSLHPHFNEKEHPHISEKIIHGIWTLEIETDAHATTCSMNYF